MRTTAAGFTGVKEVSHMAENLDTFLDGEPVEGTEPELKSEHVEPQEQVVEHAEGGEAEPAEQEGKPVEAAAEQSKPPDETKEADDVVGLRSALQAERAKRNDHKGRADRLEGEMAALKAELEAAKKPAPPPPAPKPELAAREERPAPAAPAQIPNPVEDPQGYHDYWAQREYNNRLNISETMLRTQMDNDTDVDEKIATFKRLVDANPALQTQLNNHKHPWRFAYDYAKRSMAMDEIGPDPSAYRTKLETELRAKWEAESVAAREKAEAEAAAAGPVIQAVPVREPPPRINLPTSIGTARSAGGRSAPIQVAEAFDDILGLGRR